MPKSVPDRLPDCPFNPDMIIETSQIRHSIANTSQKRHFDYLHFENEMAVWQSCRTSHSTAAIAAGLQVKISLCRNCLIKLRTNKTNKQNLHFFIQFLNFLNKHIYYPILYHWYIWIIRMISFVFLNAETTASKVERNCLKERRHHQSPPSRLQLRQSRKILYPPVNLSKLFFQIFIVSLQTVVHLRVWLYSSWFEYLIQAKFYRVVQLPEQHSYVL